MSQPTRPNYYALNKESNQRTQREYYLLNIDKIKAYRKQYYLTNKPATPTPLSDEQKEYYAAYYQSNKARLSLYYKQRYYAKKTIDQLG